MRTGADRADNEAVAKNKCQNIPDVTQPPWNPPPLLYGNSTGNNSTSNITANPTLAISTGTDSTTNLDANATLAMNSPPFATSLASLVQGTPVDSIGTS